MQRVSFSKEMDILMLREVVSSQALLQRNGSGWRGVTENLLELPCFPPILTSRSVRDRTKLLLKQYKNKIASTEGSGAEGGVMTEKAVLLQELLTIKQGRERKVFESWHGKKERKKVPIEILVREQFQAMENSIKTDYDETTMPYNHESDSPSTSAVYFPPDDQHAMAMDMNTPSIHVEANAIPANDGTNDWSPFHGKKRKAGDKLLAFLEENERQRRKEKEEEFALRRMELELQRERQEEELRLRREAEEFSREERRVHLQMMQIFMEKMTK